MPSPQPSLTAACDRASQALAGDNRATLAAALTDITVTLMSTSVPGTSRRDLAVRTRAIAAAVAVGTPLGDVADHAGVLIEQVRRA